MALQVSLAPLSQLAGNLTSGVDDIGSTYPEPDPVESEIANLRNMRF